MKPIWEPAAVVQAGQVEQLIEPVARVKVRPLGDCAPAYLDEKKLLNPLVSRPLESEAAADLVEVGVGGYLGRFPGDDNSAHYRDDPRFART